MQARECMQDEYEASNHDPPGCDAATRSGSVTRSVAEATATRTDGFPGFSQWLAATFESRGKGAKEDAPTQ